MTASSEVKRPTKTRRHDLYQKGHRKAKEHGRLDGIIKIGAGPLAVIRTKVLGTEAETAERSEDGTRKRKLMIFSTMPTAAASVTPRRFAIMVMMRKEIWINASWTAMGNANAEDFTDEGARRTKDALERPSPMMALHDKKRRQGR